MRFVGVCCKLELCLETHRNLLRGPHFGHGGNSDREVHFDTSTRSFLSVQLIISVCSQSLAVRTDNRVCSRLLALVPIPSVIVSHNLLLFRRFKMMFNKLALLALTTLSTEALLTNPIKTTSSSVTSTNPRYAAMA